MEGADLRTAELLDYVLSLRLDRVRGLLQAAEIRPIGGRTKAELRDRLGAAVENGEISIDEIVAYLDEVEPWGRQHVFLYDADPAISARWRDAASARRLLGDAGNLLDEPLPLTLPDALSLSSVRRTDGELEVVAVEARRYEERLEDLDRHRKVRGMEIEYRAYARRVARGIVTLRWDLKRSRAALHITQGEGRYDYDDTEQRFAALARWLNFPSTFSRLDLRGAVKALAERERDKNDPLTRSRRLGFESAGGREIDVSSASASRSVSGEASVDAAMKTVSAAGRGRLGNVYWLDKSVRPTDSNPLTEELHTILVGSDSRVHFMRSTTAAEVAYVLARIRSL